jgi:hypothetical protein
MIFLGITVLKLLNWLSYSHIKNKILNSHKWDLNICAGKTDGGGINADIIQHSEVKNFHLIKDIYSLPYKDGQFNTVLCSHTLEHVEDPQNFFSELQRVGKHVTILLPPLWDISAVLNVLEHRWVFFTLRTKHYTLPPHMRLPLARWVQSTFGQRLHA